MKIDIQNIPWHPKVKILEYHASGIIVIDKPTGVLSHPNDKKSTKQSIIQAPFLSKEECFQIDENTKIYLNNRLDSPTSGLVILSDSLECKNYLDKLFKENQIKKTYYALVKGISRTKETIWEDRLATQKGKNLRTQISSSGIPSKTKMRVIKSTTKTPIPVSLLELQPLTGRTHQLRVQTSQRHLPIIGDKTYGDFKINRLLEKTLKINRLCLHAREISIPLKNQSPLKIISKSPFEEWI